MDTEAMLNEILVWGVDDAIPDSVVEEVTEAIGHASTPDEYREFSLKFIRELLEAQIIEVGDWGYYGFESWGLPIEDTLERIGREWRALGSTPSLGDVFWLNLTETGKSVAEELLRQKGNGA